MSKDSPEDRLLNLIKGKHRNKAAQIDKAKKAHNPFIGDFLKKFLTDNKVFKPAYLKIANAVLTVVLIMLLASLVYTFMTPPEDLTKLTAGGDEAAKEDKAGQAQKAGAQPEDRQAVSGSISGKNIFGTSRDSDGKAQGELAGSDISKRFGLVGIMEGAEPQAIIEDKEAQKTYYLVKGQSVGGITVDDIGPGKVTMSFEGKQVILVM